VRTYLLKRLLFCVPTLLGITLVTFALSRMVPGGPLSQRLALLHEEGIEVGDEEIARYRDLLALDRPLLHQYGTWLRQSTTLDFGRSQSGDNLPVRTKIGEALAVSLGLQLVSILFIYVLSIPVGCYGAVCYGRWHERWVTLGLLLLYSIPVFVLAYLLIVLLCTGQVLSILPLHGLRTIDRQGFTWLDHAADIARHLVLPVICLSAAGFTAMTRYMRAGMVEALALDFVRTARAKGLRERTVIFKHALAHGIVPVLALLAGLFPYLLSGSVIVENIFGIPGMGRLAFDSVQSRDYPTLMALSLIIGIATMAGFLVSDLLQAAFDPRVRLR